MTQKHMLITAENKMLKLEVKALRKKASKIYAHVIRASSAAQKALNELEQAEDALTERSI